MLGLITRAKTQNRKETEPDSSTREDRGGIGLRDFSLLRQNSAIIVVLGIAAATSLLGRPYLLLMPAFARTVQHVGPPGLGVMVAASGLGSLVGSLLLASLRSLRRLDRLLILCGVSFGLALVIF